MVGWVVGVTGTWLSMSASVRVMVASSGGAGCVLAMLTFAWFGADVRA